MNNERTPSHIQISLTTIEKMSSVILQNALKSDLNHVRFSAVHVFTLI